MTDGLARILSKQGFDSENFVGKISQTGEDDLKEMRQKVQSLAEDTAVALKKNVYKNYSQFIETAKEISILEQEMYQLSHMLTDQKSVMTTMMEMSITGDKVEGPEEPEEPGQEEDLQKHLAFLLEKVEGCSSVTEVPGRTLVHDGDLLELDPESFTQISKVHLFLLNDSLMMANWLPHRRGPVKYRFQTLYELDSLAVVNARDVGQCKNAFKILMFPDTRMFQAENPKSKRQWLDILEETKKKKAAIDNQRKEAAVAAAAADRSSGISLDSTNPFAEDDEELPESRPTSVVMEVDMLHADWIQELPEDLDVCIAQRDFEGAVDLVEKINEFLAGCSKSAAVREYKARIDHRIKQLTEVLMHELQVAPERSLRGGPRAARRAVTQLVRLGKSAQACELFLNNRSSITKYNVRQLKIEGNTTLYIRRLCEVFFTGLIETTKEFHKAFPEFYGCFSSFVVWAKDELTEFVKTFSSQVFTSKTTLPNVADCVAEARRNCDQEASSRLLRLMKLYCLLLYSLQRPGSMYVVRVEPCMWLADVGLELTFVLDGMVLPEVEKILLDQIELQMEAVRHRAAEDLWRPVNYKNAETLEKFEEEMMDLGFINISNFSYDGCFTVLTANTIHFTKSFLAFCDDILKVHCIELHDITTRGILDLLRAQLKHAEASAKSDEFQKEQKYILQNATFLVETLLPVVQEKYLEAIGQNLGHTIEYKTSLQRIKRFSAAALGEFV